MRFSNTPASRRQDPRLFLIAGTEDHPISIHACKVVKDNLGPIIHDGHTGIESESRMFERSGTHIGNPFSMDS
jgi:hypothetical protein